MLQYIHLYHRPRRPFLTTLTRFCRILILRFVEDMLPAFKTDSIGRITGFRLLPIKSILAVRDARLLVQSHAKEQYGGTPGGLC